MARTAEIKRKTKETEIGLRLCIDGGDIEVSTGIVFFDHMLTALAFYAGFGVKITVKGDLEVDGHHTVEDTGIALGRAVCEALGDRTGIRRYSSVYIPMDDALAFCALDAGGRPFLRYDADMPQERAGSYETCLTWEFMRAFAFNSQITLHIRSEYGSNSHHITEAMFKALGSALREAFKTEGKEIRSTKGAL